MNFDQLWSILLPWISSNKNLFINDKTSKILYFDDEVDYDKIEFEF